MGGGQMKKSPTCMVFMMVLFLMIVSSSFASDLSDVDSFRCGGKIITYKDTKFDVLNKCGNPTMTSLLQNRWLYNFGPNRFVYHIKFVRGKVVRLKVSNYRGYYIKDSEIHEYRKRY
jgi:hypothetical protein